MHYVEFKAAIQQHLKRKRQGATWIELRETLALPYERPCPEWTRRLEAEIGLVLGFLVVLSGITLAFTVAFPLLPQSFQPVAVVVVAMFTPVSSVMRWLERRFAKAPETDQSFSKNE